MAETSRNQDRSDFALGYLKRLAHTAVFVLHQCAGGRAYLQGGQVLVFDAAGISNIQECLTVHAALVAGLKSSWESMNEEGQLASNFRTASFVDLVIFLAVVRRSRRRQKKHSWSKRLTELWEKMRFSLVKLIAACLQHKVRATIQSVPDIESRAIPSRKKRVKKKRSGGIDVDDPTNGQLVAQSVSDNEDNGQASQRQQWVQVDLDEIWNLYSDSVEVKGLSLQQIVRSKGRSREGGCSEATVVNWLGKIQAMYQHRASLGFKNEIRLNMVSDGSRHSTRDTLVTVFYAPELDIAAYGDSQVLKTAKTSPGEIACDEPVERLLAQKKADRIVAYRLCQGLSNQIQQITAGALSLESLWCDEPALAPLTSKKLRIKNGSHIQFVDKNTREVSCLVNLTDLVAKPLLVLGMDQGAPGMAASGFLRNHALIEFYFDPIHRLSRDMKGAVTSAPKMVKQRLQLAHLAATYLWGLSYKPFRSGSFHQDKVELLEMFMSSETQDMFYHVEHAT